MKLRMGLLNGSAVADSWESLVNPCLVRMVDPADGGGDGKIITNPLSIQPP